MKDQTVIQQDKLDQEYIDVLNKKQIWFQDETKENLSFVQNLYDDFTEASSGLTGKVLSPSILYLEADKSSEKLLILPKDTLLDILYVSDDWYYVMVFYDSVALAGFVPKSKVKTLTLKGEQKTNYLRKKLEIVLKNLGIDYTKLTENPGEFDKLAELMEKLGLIKLLLKQQNSMFALGQYVTSGDNGEKLVVQLSSTRNPEFGNNEVNLVISYNSGKFNWSNGLIIQNNDYTKDPLRVEADSKNEAWIIAAKYLTPNTGQKFSWNGHTYMFNYKSVSESLQDNEHIIQQGETIESIAKDYNVTVNELMTVNGYTDYQDGSAIDPLTEERHVFKPGDILAVPSKSENSEPVEPFSDLSQIYLKGIAENASMGAENFENPPAMWWVIQELRAYSPSHHELYIKYTADLAVTGMGSIDKGTYDAFIKKYFYGGSKARYSYYEEPLLNFFNAQPGIRNFPPPSYQDWYSAIYYYESLLKGDHRGYGQPMGTGYPFGFVKYFQDRAYETALDMLEINRYLLIAEAEKYGILNSTGLGFDFSSVRKVSGQSSGVVDQFYSNQDEYDKLMSIGMTQDPGSGMGNEDYAHEYWMAEDLDNRSVSSMMGSAKSITSEDPLLRERDLWPKSLLSNFTPDNQNLNLPPLNINPQSGLLPLAPSSGHPTAPIENLKNQTDEQIATKLRSIIIKKLRKIDEAEAELKSRSGDKSFIWRLPDVIEETKYAMGIQGEPIFEAIIEDVESLVEFADAVSNVVTTGLSIGLLFIPGGGWLAFAASAGIQAYAMYERYQQDEIVSKLNAANLDFGETLSTEDRDLDWIWLDILLIAADIPAAGKVFKAIASSARKFMKGTISFKKFMKGADDAAKLLKNGDELVEFLAKKYNPKGKGKGLNLQKVQKERNAILNDPTHADELSNLRSRYPDASDTELAGHIRMRLKQGSTYKFLKNALGSESTTFRLIVLFGEHSPVFLKGIKKMKAGLSENNFKEIIEQILIQQPKLRSVIVSVGESGIKVADMIKISKQLDTAYTIQGKMRLFMSNLMEVMGRRAGTQKGMEGLMDIVGHLDKKYVAMASKSWLSKYSDVPELLTKLKGSSKLSKSGLKPKDIDQLYETLVMDLPQSTEEILKGIDKLVDSGTKFENFGRMLDDIVSKDLHFADGSKWVLEYVSSANGVKEFGGKTLYFELSQRVDGAGMRYIDLAVDGSGKRIFYEFKSVKSVPPGKFNEQFIKDLEIADDLSQIKWVFDASKKPANFEKNMMEAIDNLPIGGELTKRYTGVDDPQALKSLLKSNFNSIFLKR